MPGFEGMRALVTGGSRGIGAATASALMAKGAHVTILGRDKESLESRVAQGGACAYAVADLADQSGFERTMAAIADQAPIDILVNNAGSALSAPFARTTTADFSRILDINLMAPIIAIRSVLPAMVARKFGRIVNICSTAALKGYPYVSAYVASKHGLLGLTRALAIEVAKAGVTVNAVCPGFVDTDMVAEAIHTIVEKTGRNADAARGELVKANPMGRLIAPQEVAETVCFLAGREAGAITGAAIAVAGGEI
jgi:3-hydroxybutyrate dehydrogenase